MNKYGRFGALLGTIFIGNTHCKFLVYAARNAEVLTCHEVQLVQISNEPGWIEFDPIEIWKCVIETIKVATSNLILLEINPNDIIALSITNQRETSLLWHRNNGTPLYNAIAWNDTRTTSTVNTILSRIRNKTNYLKSVCGLPLSTCFSAIKIKWIMDNIPGVLETIENRQCLFGTLDCWILWNLTGGIFNGLHITDVTNASRTMLMNLETLQWDKKLCGFFKIPLHILPTIKSCSEIYGVVHDGPLQGIPIAGCLGEQSAALLGEMCLKTNQATCTFDEGCFLLMNCGQEIIDSDNGLITTVAFKLGTKEKAFYALEGFISNAGSAISWLQNNLQLNSIDFNNYTNTTINCWNNNNNNINNTYIEQVPVTSIKSNYINDNNNRKMNTDVVFVPAFSGLFSPFWKHNSSGLILGLNNHTTAKHVTLAAYEAICFQTRDLLESLTKDLPTWSKLTKLTVGGEFTENKFFLQLLADLCGVSVERPQTTSPSCLGAMIAAGLAMNILTLENIRLSYAPPVDSFQVNLCSSQRDLKYRRWKYAVKKCINLHNIKSEISSELFKEDIDPDVTVRCSIPGSIYIISSIALVMVTNFLHRK